MKNNYLVKLTYSRKCAQCGKTFEVCLPEEWAYRVKNTSRLLCTWSCLRAWERAHTKQNGRESA